VETEPLLLLWPSREYRRGDPITVDGTRMVIHRVLMDTSTVLHAELVEAPSVPLSSAA
jgi:hypothetical protein